MVAQQQLSGMWNELKGKVKEQWGAVTDDDFKRCEGDVDQLIGLIQKKTGEARGRIERQLSEWSQNSASMVSAATSAAQDYAAQAVAAAKEGWGSTAQAVKRHPAETALISFGSGVLLGVVLGLISQRRS